MAKSNKVKTKAVLTRAVLTAGAAVLLISLFLYLAKRKGERIIDECGIPDAVSSISDGENAVSLSWQTAGRSGIRKRLPGK